MQSCFHKKNKRTREKTDSMTLKIIMNVKNASSYDETKKNLKYI